MRQDGKPQPYSKKNKRIAMGWVLLAFIIGYLSAAFFDFDHLLAWCKKNLFNVKNESVSSQVTRKSPSLPKPKFEFYTMLTKDQRVVPSLEARPTVALQPSSPAIPVQKPTPPILKTEKPPIMEGNNTAVIDSKSAYWVQVASFKNKTEASRAKASLLLKGFDVTIFAAPHPGWFRVVLGPFSSKQEAQKTQVAFAQSEHVQGMIRQFNA